MPSHAHQEQAVTKDTDNRATKRADSYVIHSCPHTVHQTTMSSDVRVQHSQYQICFTQSLAISLRLGHVVLFCLNADTIVTRLKSTTVYVQYLIAV